MSNEIKTLVSTYNTFISDIVNLITDLHNLLQKDLNLKYNYEGWSPRDRYSWSSKERFYSLHELGNNTLFYIGIDLKSDVPYLLIYKIELNLQKAKMNEFGEYDSFTHIENSNKEKTEIYKYVYKFEKDWGINYFVKTDLLSISSSDIINNEIKSICKYLIDGKYDLIQTINTITFLE
ncbi:MAG: hypothetical protein IPL26_13285 [Leptospiraceae bacterium]|nr:hypothetical protein [Leptospiraceae bacterium]